MKWPLLFPITKLNALLPRQFLSKSTKVICLMPSASPLWRIRVVVCFFFNKAKQQTLHKILHTRRRDINKGHNISPVKRQADINAGIDLGLWLPSFPSSGTSVRELSTTRRFMQTWEKVRAHQHHVENQPKASGFLQKACFCGSTVLKTFVENFKNTQR